MNIWPTAPQAAKERTSGKTAGCRAMKFRAAASSLLLVIAADAKESELGSRGDSIRYIIVRKVERTFCATIICGPVYVLCVPNMWS